MNIITSESRETKALDKIEKGFIPSGNQMARISKPVLKGKTGVFDDKGIFDSTMAAGQVSSKNVRVTSDIKKYGSAFDMPKFCASRETEMSVREMVEDGVFANPKMSSNTLIPDWQSLWNALIVDISVNSAVRDTVRQYLYSIENRPDSDQTFDVRELFDYGFTFEEHNGEGQAVEQGETRGGQTDTITNLIYAGGWTHTLLAALFDRTFNLEKISKSVSRAYNLKRDDLAMSPVLGYSYIGSAATAANALSGATRQELLYNTLMDGIEDLFARTDPITTEHIAPSGLVLLMNPIDSFRVSTIINGFTSSSIGGQDAPKNLPAISAFSNMIEYETQSVLKRAKTVTYTGVSQGTAYIIKPNRYMSVNVKRGLSLEADAQPDVSTLAQGRQSWYFSEAIYHEGKSSFIQELTLPAW